MRFIILLKLLLAVAIFFQFTRAWANQEEPDWIAISDLVKKELAARQETNESAYIRTLSLCYVFKFRHSRKLPLVTTFVSFILEDGYLISNISSDSFLRQSLKEWMWVQSRGVLQDQLSLHRLTQSPLYKKAVEECSSEIGIDLLSIIDNEISLSYSSGIIAFTIATLYGSNRFLKALGRIPGVRPFFSSHPQLVTSLNVAVTLATIGGISLLYFEYKNTKTASQHLQKNILSIDALRIQSENQSALKHKELRTAVKKFALGYLQWVELAHDVREPPIQLNAMAHELKLHSEDIVKMWQEAEAASQRSQDEEAKMILASIAIFQKFLKDGE